MLLLFNAIVKAFSNQFDSNSPAKAMYEYGENIFDGIIEGFKEKMKNYNFIELMKELYDYFNTDEETTTNGDVKSGQSPTHTLSDAEGARNKLHVKIKTELTGDAKSTEDLSKLTDSFKGLTDEASKGATSKFDTESDTSVVEQSINYGGLSKARSSWKKTTTSKFDTNPDTSKVNESITSGGLFKAIKSWAITTTSKFDTNPDTSKVDDSISKGSLKNAKEKWQNTKPVSEFITKDNVEAVKNALGSNGTLTTQKNAWNNTTATSTFKTNANVDSVKNALAGNGALTTQKNAWNNTKATATFNTSPNVNDVNYSRQNAKGSLYQAQQAWNNTKATATFGTKPNTDDVNYSMNHNDKGSLKKAKEDWQNTTAWAKFTGYTDLKDVTYSFYNPGGSYYKLWDAWNKETATSTFSANFSYNENDLSKSIKNMTEYIQTQLNGITLKVKVSTTNQESVPKALGGSYYGGSWHDIPQYARGGKPNYGSMFIAGEAGPEIVGHLNGRTEVLNKSQIASTIHSAFVSSMAQFGNRMLATPESVAIQSGTYSAYNSSMNDGQTALLAEQNRLLAEQNQLLMEIASKDVSISSRDVFNAVKSESKRYNNMTGSSPFLF